MQTDALLARIETLTQTVKYGEESLKAARLLIDKLTLEVTYLQRMR